MAMPTNRLIFNNADYRAIKRMNHKQMSEYWQRVWESGYMAARGFKVNPKLSDPDAAGIKADNAPADKTPEEEALV